MSSTWTSDLRHAWRALSRTPGFLVTSIGTLALAIGAAVGMFSVVSAVLLKPLPFRDPDRLVVISGTAPGSDLGETFGPGLEFFVHYREQSKLLDGIFVFQGGTSTLRTDDRVERISMLFPSQEMWATLGATPLRGRLPVPEDGEEIMVLSHRLWMDWFGGDTAVIGRSYFAAGTMRQVIGVMPPDFAFPTDQTLLWINDVIRLDNITPGNFGWPMVARLKAGVTRDQLAAELTQLSKGLPDRFGGSPSYARIIAQHGAVVVPALDRLVGPTVRTSLWVLLGAVTIVLIIACANVTNLFLVRVEARHRDLAVRLALGAGRGRLARLQLAEGLVVAILAGMFAIVLSIVTLPLFLRVAPSGIPRLETVGLDPLTLLTAFVLVLVVGLACSFVPAMRASAPELSRLREGGRTGSGRRHWGRDALVVGQTALALMLLIGAALLVRSFQQLSHVDPGYETADLYTFQFAPQQQQLTDGPAWGRLHLDFMDRLRALPGVTMVGVVNNIPLDEGTGTTRYRTEQMPPDAGGTLLDENFTGGSYFQAMGISLIRGRVFSDDEAVTPNSNVIISQSAADAMWPQQDPIGKQLTRVGNTPLTFQVVGVVEDVKQDDWREAGEAVVYYPLTGPTPTSWSIGTPAYVVKSPRAHMLQREVRELVRQIAPEAPVYREFTLEFLARRAMTQLSFTMRTLGVVALLALILGAVGLYGVLSYVVEQRTREIGVRMALGATEGAVQQMVVSQGARVVMVGIGIGLLGAVAATRSLGSLLYGVAAVDPIVFAAMAAMLLLVGIFASWLPARRASRVDPIESLRSE